MNHPCTSPASTALLKQALLLAEANHAFAWATVIRAAPPSSAYVGAQALVAHDGTLHGWVGGGCARDIVVRSCQEAIRSKQSKLIRISNEAAGSESATEHHAMPCASNGSLEIFIQPVNPAPLLYVMGNTPAAAAARQFAQLLNWQVASPETPLQDCSADYVLVATQGDEDASSLEQALGTQAKKVLLVASSRKAGSLLASMRYLGFSEARLADIDSPAGPDILAQTPAEVALAAVAGLVHAHRQETGRPQTLVASQAEGQINSKAEPPSAPAAAALDSSSYINPVCLRVIDPATALHTVRIDGIDHYFCCNGCKAKFDAEPAKYLARAGKADNTPVAKLIAATSRVMS